eukprot:CAMPEP_0197613962 /NCGR_PEP_ID=MMETSP1326-20131121/59284_1 /TAXON_ID=1155430 /ORGANISM="Genus nov. species nov., Strain RCC2288" /LENGTH=272 /DNA_ID=CAMNT_0043182831 /DNA_START=221 /DNA_END=1039 /DNA_ORIENTATION=+
MSASVAASSVSVLAAGRKAPAARVAASNSANGANKKQLIIIPASASSSVSISNKRSASAAPRGASVRVRGFNDLPGMNPNFGGKKRVFDDVDPEDIAAYAKANPKENVSLVNVSLDTSQYGKNSSKVDLSRDFGGLVGGFPGGEVGVKAFNATGALPTRDAKPTLGWGPPVLLLAAIGGTGYFLNPGLDPVETLGGAVSGVTSVTAAVDEALAPEQKVVLLQAGAVGLGLVLAGVAIKTAAQKVGAALDTAVRVGVLGALVLAAAGKVLDLY